MSDLCRNCAKPRAKCDCMDSSGFPRQWKGIFKLIEECGELTQVLGKIAAFPEGPHPDEGGIDGQASLVSRLEDEMADVMAAIFYFGEQNELDLEFMKRRMASKVDRFNEWDLVGAIRQGE